MSTSLAVILPALKAARAQGKQLVLATGVFDLLHQEHHNFLTQAKQAGDLLVVGVETDSRVTQMKGPGRPINPQASRLRALNQLNVADYTFLLPAQFNTQADWETFIDQLRPDIYAVSSHTSHLKNKRLIMKKYGGRVKIVHQHNPAVSTTQLLKKPLKK